MTLFQNIIGIHGAPRSGTSWLGQLFNSSPQVAYRFQPFFSFAFKNRISELSTDDEIINFFNDLYLTKDDFVLQLKNVSGNQSTNFNKTTTPFLVYKEVRYHYLIKRFLNSSHPFKFIGIVRNPCAVINSWTKAPKEFNTNWRIEEEWRFANKKNQNKPEEYNGFEKWLELTSDFVHFEKKYPDKFRIIQYENLLINTLEETEKAFKFCGIEISDQTLKFIENSKSFNQNNDPYSVFRLNQKADNWKYELNTKITEQIFELTKLSKLERFLL